MIPYGKQSISEADVAAVIEVLNSDFLTQGPAVGNFERTVTNYCGTTYGVAVSSATAALHVACLALDLQAGDLLWTVPNTFVASANCARYCGAEVDFVDIDQTRNMSVAALEEKLILARKRGHLPKVVVPVAFSGLACDMKGIRALSDKFGFKILEDASHAIGARYAGNQVGCGLWSDITVFSFHPVKIVTTGEGGIAVTRDKQLAARMTRLRSHGITRDPDLMESPPEGAWVYEMQELGWNYRITDIQAALGISQFRRLDEFVSRRNVLAARYGQLLADTGLDLPPFPTDPDSLSSWHLYVIGWNEQRSGLKRAEAYAGLQKKGIGVNVHYMPVHLQPYYRRLGFAPGMFPVAEAYSASALTLPLFPQLTEKEQDQVVEAVRSLAQR
jgi:UDP-4-amino-4,6-dideoxy-N-acetyl-beta-L-altrosamine transaminase